MNASGSEWVGVDIGNSGTKLARLLLEADEPSDIARIDWKFHGGARASSTYAPDDPAWLSEVTQWLATFSGSAPPTALEWVISSVRRDALRLLLELIERLPGHRARVLGYRDLQRSGDASPASRGDLHFELQVNEPERVGIDRLLAGLAAATRHAHRPLIVIQAGSAVTVDLVSGEAGDMAVFEGGAILPGIPMILRLLGQAADLLPEIEAGDLSQLPDLPGRDTEQAMRVGAASSLIGGVQHAVARYRQAYGESTPVIISGGDRLRLATYLPNPRTCEPDLVMRGLQLVARRLSCDDSSHT